MVLYRGVVPEVGDEVVDPVRRKLVAGVAQLRVVQHHRLLEDEGPTVGGVEALATATQPIVIAVDEAWFRLAARVQHCGG